MPLLSDRVQSKLTVNVSFTVTELDQDKEFALLCWFKVNEYVPGCEQLLLGGIPVEKVQGGPPEKVAVTLSAEFITTMQFPEPEHAPDQPEKV